jgi:predicted kinase
MKKLIMCQGLPGSGKTTWALEQVKTNPWYSCQRVNKDDIRAGLETTGWRWSRENEKRVIELRDQYISDKLTHDGMCQTVISDDTNLDRKHKTRLAEIARECGAAFEIKKFTHAGRRVHPPRQSTHRQGMCGREGHSRHGRALPLATASARLQQPCARHLYRRAAEGDSV